MKRSDAVLVDRAERQFVAAAAELKAAGTRFAEAREAKRKAEAELVEALARKK